MESGTKKAKPAQPTSVQTEKKTVTKKTASAETENNECKCNPKGQLGFYAEIYRQVEQGVDGIQAIMPYVESKAMKNLFTSQQKHYETLAVDLKTKIVSMGGDAEKPTMMERLMMKSGTMFSTMVDRSDSRIAELMLKGVNMGVISLTRLMNDCQGREVDVQYGNKLLSLYDKQSETLKSFL